MKTSLALTPFFWKCVCILWLACVTLVDLVADESVLLLLNHLDLDVSVLELALASVLIVTTSKQRLQKRYVGHMMDWIQARSFPIEIKYVFVSDIGKIKFQIMYSQYIHFWHNAGTW